MITHGSTRVGMNRLPSGCQTLGHITLYVLYIMTCWVVDLHLKEQLSSLLNMTRIHRSGFQTSFWVPEMCPASKSILLIIKFPLSRSVSLSLPLSLSLSLSLSLCLSLPPSPPPLSLPPSPPPPPLSLSLSLSFLSLHFTAQQPPVIKPSKPFRN